MPYRRLMILACVALLSGCAFQPIVDRPGPGYTADLTECQATASQQAGAGTGAAVGAGSGYVLGRILAGAFGASNTSQTGRAAGLIGGLQGAAAFQAQQNAIVRNCLIGRGHRVLN